MNLGFLFHLLRDRFLELPVFQSERHGFQMQDGRWLPVFGQNLQWPREGSEHRVARFASELRWNSRS